MNYILSYLLFIQLLIQVECFVPNINACYDNKKILHNSLTLLRASLYNKNRWEPPDGYVPIKKETKWVSPEGYIPERLKKDNSLITNINDSIANIENEDELYTNNTENIQLEIDKILNKIEKIRDNVKNINRYNKKK